MHLLFGSVTRREQNCELNPVMGPITHHLPDFETKGKSGCLVWVPQFGGSRNSAMVYVVRN